LTDSCSGVHGVRGEVEVDSGISRTTDDSLRNDDSSSEHDVIDTDSPSSSDTRPYVPRLSSQITTGSLKRTVEVFCIETVSGLQMLLCW